MKHINEEKYLVTTIVDTKNIRNLEDVKNVEGPTKEVKCQTEINQIRNKKYFFLLNCSCY